MTLLPRSEHDYGQEHTELATFRFRGRRHSSSEQASRANNLEEEPFGFVIPMTTEGKLNSTRLNSQSH